MIVVGTLVNSRSKGEVVVRSFQTSNIYANTLNRKHQRPEWNWMTGVIWMCGWCMKWLSQYCTLLERMVVHALKIGGEQFCGSYWRDRATVLKNYNIMNMGSCYFEIVLCANCQPLKNVRCIISLRVFIAAPWFFACGLFVIASGGCQNIEL